MRHFATALLALLATTANADPASDYARLQAGLPGLTFGTDIQAILQKNTDLIQSMTGRWILADLLMGDTGNFPDMDLLNRVCEKNGFDIAPEGSLSLKLSMPTETVPHVIHLVYVGGSTFVASVEEAGKLARLFPGKDATELEPSMLYGVMVGEVWSGYVQLISAGEDLVLVQPLVRAPMLLARCS